MKLFLLPPAGASAAVFHPWRERRELDGVDLVPVELPGRGARLGEPLRDALPALVDDLVERHSPEPGEAWGIVGHSMGALLGAAWAARAAAAGAPARLLLVSASAPPWLHSTAAELDGPPEDLWRRVAALGGLPPVIREAPAARLLFGRVLAADVAASAAYRPSAPEPVGCPVVAVRGATDPLVPAALTDAWGQLTDRAFTTHVLPGGHFYDAGLVDLIPVVASYLMGATEAVRT